MTDPSQKREVPIMFEGRYRVPDVSGVIRYMNSPPPYPPAWHIGTYDSRAVKDKIREMLPRWGIAPLGPGDYPTAIPVQNVGRQEYIDYTIYRASTGTYRAGGKRKSRRRVLRKSKKTKRTHKH